MTVIDQIKILNRKIMQNKAQDDLDKEAAKISTLFSNNLDKYEYLTGEGLCLKQVLLNKRNLCVLHWAKFLLRD